MAARKPSLDTAADLNSAAIHLLRGLRATDRSAGLTPARLSALSVIVFGGPTPLGRLARAEDVAGPTMTRIVDGLVALGLAQRQRHPDAANIVLVAATSEGERVMHEARQARLDVIAAALARLPHDQRRAIAAAAPALRSLAAEVGTQSTTAATKSAKISR
jgi:DNA-binding MarR family transcriptional regulator